MENAKLLEEIKRRIYFKALKEDDVLIAIRKAKDDIQRDVELKCKHDFVYITDGYGYRRCTKCGMASE